MHRMILVLALSALFAPAVSAGVPSPGNSIVPPLITLGASDGLSPDPTLAFVVEVRDLANNPLSGSTTVIDFTDCPDVVLGTITGPGTIVNCAARTVRRNTGLDGRSEFRLTGAVGARSPASIGARARVFSDGVLLATIRVAVLDQDGAEGVDAKDLSLWLHDAHSGTHPARSDLNGDGAVSVLDLPLFYAAAARASQQESAARCDGGATLRPTIPEGTLELSWGDCFSEGGTSLQTFSCASNSGSSSLIAAAQLPQARADLLAFEAEVELFAPTVAALPDYWQLQPGGCSESRAYASPSTLSNFCATPWVQLDNVRILSVTPSAGGDPRRAVLRMMGAMAEPGTIAANITSSIFQFQMHRTRTVGAGACAGCTTPVAFWLRSVRLARGVAGSGAITAPDLVLSAPAIASTAFWQAVTGVVPAQRATWGHLKTRYR